MHDTLALAKPRGGANHDTDTSHRLLPHVPRPPMKLTYYVSRMWYSNVLKEKKFLILYKNEFVLILYMCFKIVKPIYLQNK